MDTIVAAGGLALLAGCFALILVSAAKGLYWSLFAARVSGTVIGVREHRGKEFVAVYRYVDQTGTMWEAMSEHGCATLDLMKTGATVSLLMFPSRPERVQETASACGFQQLSLCVFRFLLFLAFLGVPGTAIFFRIRFGTATIYDGVPAAAVMLVAALKIWDIQRDVALKHYGPIELAENITPERGQAVRAAAARDA